MQKYFEKLDESVLVEQNCWTKILQHDSVKDVIPLPMTNTENGRGMRHAALLSICAVALERYIFQSSHLCDTDNQLSEILDNLADEDPEREAHIRSVLLPIQPVGEGSYHRVDVAFKAISDCALPLLSTVEHASFQSSLRGILVNACELWRRVQELDTKIMPLIEVVDVEDWTLIPLKHLASSKKSDPAVNGNKRSPSDASKSSKQSPASKAKIVVRDIRIVLWPAFVIIEDGDLLLLAKGNAVLTWETKEAQEEVFQARITGPRRQARQNTRGAAKRKPSVTRSEKPTSDQRLFLSEGGGTG